MKVYLNNKYKNIILEAVEMELETYEDLEANDIEYDKDHLDDLKGVVELFRDLDDECEEVNDREEIGNILRGDLSDSLRGYIDSKIDTYHEAISCLSLNDENYVEELVFLSYELQEWSRMRWELLDTFDNDLSKVNREFIERFRQRLVYFIEDADMIGYLLKQLGMGYE